MPFSDITPLPPAPQRGDDPDTFDALADPFVASLPGMVTELNNSFTELETAAALINAAPEYADAGLVSIADLTIGADEMIYGTATDTFGKTTITAFGRSLIDDVDASAARTTLGMSANGSSLVSAADYSAMRTLLGLVIGTNVQAQDAELSALAALTSAANKVPRFTGSGTADLLDFLDEDTMSSDSATAVPSQQSVKAYVDASAPTISSSGTATSGYMDIETTGLGTIRINWGRTTVGANSTSSPSLAASYTTALVGGGQAMTTATGDTDSSYCYLSSTSAMSIANGTDGSLTFQWWAIGVA